VLVLVGNAACLLPAYLPFVLNMFHMSCSACAALQELDVSSNQLSSLPPTLGSLSKLKVLQADSNNIAAVPGQLLQGCSALHTLSLHSNPITPAELEGTPGYQEYDARRR
jgi:hypothetical protein